MTKINEYKFWIRLFLCLCNKAKYICHHKHTTLFYEFVIRAFTWTKRLSSVQSGLFEVDTSKFKIVISKYGSFVPAWLWVVVWGGWRGAAEGLTLGRGFMRGIAGSEGGVRGGFTIREKHIKITTFECPWLIDSHPYLTPCSSLARWPTTLSSTNILIFRSIKAVVRKLF